MSRSHTFHWSTFVLPLLLGCIALSTCCFAQATVSIPPTSSVPGATVAIPISVSSTGVQPAALQIRIAYPASDIVSVAVTAGPVCRRGREDRAVLFAGGIRNVRRQWYEYRNDRERSSCDSHRSTDACRVGNGDSGSPIRCPGRLS